MRECPLWVQTELSRIGGVNHFGDPIFKLVWSTDPKMMVGGRFADGFEGYRYKREISSEPCWALMIWEPAAMVGSPIRWSYDYRDPETGFLECGAYPKYGRYRLLQKFIHREIVNGQLKTSRMEPCGFMLDIMLPMLKAWRRLTDSAKVEALKEEERAEKVEYLRKVKDAHDGCRIKRGSALVAKRAEVIERGMAEAMRIASQSGLGMQIG
jgi:hypothetical protein